MWQFPLHRAAWSRQERNLLHLQVLPDTWLHVLRTASTGAPLPVEGCTCAARARRCDASAAGREKPLVFLHLREKPARRRGCGLLSVAAVDDGASDDGASDDGASDDGCLPGRAQCPTFSSCSKAQGPRASRSSRWQPRSASAQPAYALPTLHTSTRFASYLKASTHNFVARRCNLMGEIASMMPGRPPLMPQLTHLHDIKTDMTPRR